MLRSYQAIMLGETNAITSTFTSLTGNEKTVLVILCAVIIAFGVYPKPLLDISEPAVTKLVNSIEGLRI